MSVKVVAHLLGLGIRKSKPIELPATPNVGDWICLDDDADGTISEVFKVIYDTELIHVIVELLGPAEVVTSVLGKIDTHEELSFDNIKKLVSKEFDD